MEWSGIEPATSRSLARRANYSATLSYHYLNRVSCHDLQVSGGSVIIRWLASTNPKACPPGSYGVGCSKRCSRGCVGQDNICDPVNGTCGQGCEPGHVGDKCDHKCDVGFYGQACNKTCSEHCAGEDNSCNHITGFCDKGCDRGYHTATCTKKCETGSFGEGCRQRCSVHCAGEDNSCHHVTGACDHGCEPGYLCPLGHEDWYSLELRATSHQDVLNGTVIAIVVVALAIAAVTAVGMLLCWVSSAGVFKARGMK
ncbi:multiple epidermal growth factor-like domains 10 [Elysia marginata]|uniref:Multiple epidermal growth factor-like domains 10 n=1 Tax=Elysia marginata TaxID=1093978 RepID=A0AAV4I386_9GAST|nr:multiple epidermal growth factor-like domains 10 [Elysia marginata]